MAAWLGDQTAARVARIQAIGTAEGLTLDLHKARPVNTFNAHRLIHLAAGRGLADEMMEALFHAYHTDGLNVADPEVLRRLGTAIGLNRDEINDLLAGDAYAADVRADERRTSEHAITGIPAIAIDGKPPVSAVQSSAMLRRLLDRARREQGTVRVTPDRNSRGRN